MLVSSVPLSLTIIAGRALGNRPVQLPRNPQARDRGVGDKPDTLSGEVIDHRKNAKPALTGEGIRHEVERPALVATLWDRHRCPRA